MVQVRFVSKCDHIGPYRPASWGVWHVILSTAWTAPCISSQITCQEFRVNVRVGMNSHSILRLSGCACAAQSYGDESYGDDWTLMCLCFVASATAPPTAPSRKSKAACSRNKPCTPAAVAAPGACPQRPWTRPRWSHGCRWDRRRQEPPPV